MQNVPKDKGPKGNTKQNKQRKREKQGTRLNKAGHAISEQYSDALSREQGALDAIKELRNEIAELKAAATEKKVSDNQNANLFAMMDMINEIDGRKVYQGPGKVNGNFLLACGWLKVLFIIVLMIELCFVEWHDSVILRGCLVIYEVIYYVVVVYVLVLIPSRRIRRLLTYATIMLFLPRISIKSKRYSVLDIDFTPAGFEVGEDLRLNSVRHVELKSPEAMGRFRRLTQDHVDFRFCLFGEKFKFYTYVHDVSDEQEWCFSTTLVAELCGPSIFGVDTDYDLFKARCQAKMNNEHSVNINKYLAGARNIYQGSFILAATMWTHNCGSFEGSGF